MKNYERKNLNVKHLLSMELLDIRGMADQNETLTANEYFTKVEQFIENAPKLIETLTNISKLAENAKALKELEAKLGVGERSVVFANDTAILTDLENIKKTLSEIGYNHLDFDLDATCLAVQNANLQLTEKLASEAVSKFSALYAELKVTYTVKKFAKVQTETEADNDPYAEVLLTEAIEYLEYEAENKKPCILAVDDISIVLNTLTSVLSPYYEVFALKKSSQVEKLLTHITPDLFLLDIEMSEVNGFDLVPLIRRFEKHKDTPIIFLTGNSSYSNLKDALALGACDFIAKPVNKEILLEKIAKNIVRKKV